MAQTITSGKREFKIYHFTGKVAGASKNMETKVSGRGGGRHGHVRINSKTTVHDELFLIDQQGKERALQLQDFDVACREGNIITASWAIGKDKENGPYFAITNHTTGQKFTKNITIKKLVLGVYYRSQLFGCLFGGVLLFGFFTLLSLAVIFPIFSIVLIGLVGYVVYQNAALIPKKVKEFKNAVKYPTTEKW